MNLTGYSAKRGREEKGMSKDKRETMSESSHTIHFNGRY